MAWKYGRGELESWLGGHLSKKEISRLKQRGNIFSSSGIGGVRSKKEMDILLDLVAEQSDISKSKLRRLRWEMRDSASARKSLVGEDYQRGPSGREGPAALDVGKDRVQELREAVGQEHYLIKYKKTEAGKERSILESKRIQELAREGQSWRDIKEDDDKKRTPLERAQHRSALNQVTQRRTRLD